MHATCGKVGNVIPLLAGSDKARIQSRYMAIIEEVCRRNWVTPDEVLGGSREDYIRAARNQCIFEIRKKMGFSTTRLGNIFKKDHSTIVHILKKIRAEDVLKNEPLPLPGHPSDMTLLRLDY